MASAYFCSKPGKWCWYKVCTSRKGRCRCYNVLCIFTPGILKSLENMYGPLQQSKIQPGLHFKKRQVSVMKCYKCSHQEYWSPWKYVWAIAAKKNSTWPRWVMPLETVTGRSTILNQVVGGTRGNFDLLKSSWESFKIKCLQTAQAFICSWIYPGSWLA